MKTLELLKTALPNNSVQFTTERYVNRFDYTVSNSQKRLNEAAELNRDYYALVTDFYLHGWGKMFHFGARKKGETFPDSLIRHEMFLAEKLNLKKGEWCLDIGCGVAGPMINIAKKTNADILGINNSSYQVQKANCFIREEELQAQCRVMECDWMKIPLPDAVYDKAYAIEATCHAADKRKELFTEIYRVLKPGGLFVGYDWVMTENFDPANPIHQAIKYDIEIGDGISNLNFTSDVLQALRKAGFEIIEFCDKAKECDPETPWYLPLKGERLSLQTLRISPVGRWVMQHVLELLETIRILPRGTSKVHRMLLEAADALVKGGELDIFTPMLYFKARKN